MSLARQVRLAGPPPVRNENPNPPKVNRNDMQVPSQIDNESNRQGPGAGEFMSYCDDDDSTDPKQTPSPRPDRGESDGPTGWLYALNSFLERAFREADRDTGC
jgi:hypothetical protein